MSWWLAGWCSRRLSPFTSFTASAYPACSNRQGHAAGASARLRCSDGASRQRSGSASPGSWRGELPSCFAGPDVRLTIMRNMKKKVFALLLVAAPPFLAMPAHAVPNIENLAVKPSGGAPGEVEIAISINRPTPLDLSCDAILQTGDGGKPQRLE